MQINKKLKGTFDKQTAFFRQITNTVKSRRLKIKFSEEKSNSFASGLFMAVGIVTAEHLHICIFGSHAHRTRVCMEPTCFRDWRWEQMSGNSQVCPVRGTQRGTFKSVSAHEILPTTYVSNPPWGGKGRKKERKGERKRIYTTKSGSEVFSKSRRHFFFLLQSLSWEEPIPPGQLIKSSIPYLCSTI